LITGRVTLSTIGKTAFAGPLTNITLGYALLFLSFLTSGSIISLVLGWGAYVNSILAIFNLIPFGVLDGQKIMSWNMRVWAIGIAFSAVLFFVSRAF
jgi:Zn-dependent protease